MKFSACFGLWLFLFLFSPILLANEYTVAFYNIENLFDADHDPGKEDWEFLPLDHPLKAKCTQTRCKELNWTEDAYRFKLQRTADSIEAAFGDKLPDIIGFAELENRRTLRDLGKLLGYEDMVMEEGPDERGIDLGLLINPIASQNKIKVFHLDVKLHMFELIDSRGEIDQTRPILEAKLELDGKPLFVLANHWPAPYHPAEDRVKAAEKLKTVIEQIEQENAMPSIVMMGDFNIIETENPDPIRSILQEPLNDFLAYDVYEDLFLSSPQVESSQKEDPKYKQTYYYFRGKVWNRLDRFYVNKPLAEAAQGLKLDVDSYTVHHHPTLIETFTYSGFTYEGIPRKFFHDRVVSFLDKNSYSKEPGYSDHLPISLTISTDE